MHTPLPPCILNGDGHGRSESLAGRPDEILGVGRARQPKEEGRAHVNEQDPPKYLTNRPRHGDTGVFGLGGSHGDGLAPGIKRAAKDKNGGDATEARDEGARVMPVLEAQSGRALDAASYVDDGEEEEGNQTA